MLGYRATRVAFPWDPATLMPTVVRTSCKHCGSLRVEQERAELMVLQDSLDSLDALGQRLLRSAG